MRWTFDLAAGDTVVMIDDSDPGEDVNKLLMSTGQDNRVHVLFTPPPGPAQ